MKKQKSGSVVNIASIYGMVEMTLLFIKAQILFCNKGWSYKFKQIPCILLWEIQCKIKLYIPWGNL